MINYKLLNIKKISFRNSNAIFFSILLLLFFIFLTNYHFLHISYFYSDHRWFENLHNLSLNKGFFEILINSTNINGIIWQPVNHNLNILSRLNFNLNSDKDYLIYLSIIRVFEIATILLYVKYFTKKNFKSIILPVLLIFYVSIHNFQIFDHNSYINFPIIIFNFGIALSLFFIDKKIYFFLILFVTNFFSFFINPIYFFVPCFLPLIFLYTYLLYSKKYKNIFITIFSNLPFTIMFSLIAMGTGRINFTDKLNTLDSWYNFELFQSPIFLILFFTFFTLSLLDILRGKKVEFLDLIFFFIFPITLLLGFIWKYNLINWQLPQPQYYDYSFQYIYLSFFVYVLLLKKFDAFKFISYLILIIIFSYKTVGFSRAYINHLNYMKEDTLNYYDLNNSLVKRFFWEKDSKLFFKQDLKNKTIFLNIPNKNTELFNYVWKGNGNYTEDQKLVLLKYQNFKKFNHNLWHNHFHDSNVRTDVGHSAYMGISTYLANMYNDKKMYDKETIPNTSFTSHLVNIYNPDYYLTDKKLPLRLKKKYQFHDFNIYLYYFDKKKLLKNYTFKFDNNISNYMINLKNFDNTVYISDKKNIKKEINTICEFKTKFPNKYTLIYQIQNNNNKKCLAILPLTFSFTNIIYYEGKSETCSTFRVQYHFHGCYIDGNKDLIVKKVNQIKYPYYSFKDFLSYRELTNE